MYADKPGAPLNIHVTNITSSTISLAWSPPSVSERNRQNILGYHIICLSLTSVLGSYDNVTRYKDTLNITLDPLYPFTAYNCCVAASTRPINGRGRLACLRVVTRES